MEDSGRAGGPVKEETRLALNDNLSGENLKARS